MVRLYVVLIVAAVVFSIYAVADCAFFDRSRVRGLSRGWWIVVILFVPIIGGLLWFIIGRGRAGRSSGGGRTRTIAPDDDADFLRRLGTEAEQAERIRRMEQELADLDGDGASGDGGQADGTAGTERNHPDTPETPGESGPSGRPNG